MCFFFFKQKTAYEMRISDWSSDVCSSDLQHRQYLDHRRKLRLWPVAVQSDMEWLVHRRLFRRVGVIRLRPPGGDAAMEPAAACELPHAHRAGGDVAAGEIGRASCRERVCTEV